MNSASDKKTQVQTVKQKENVCPETEFVNCGVTLNAASDQDKQAVKCRSDVNETAVNNILSLQHRPGKLSTSNTNSIYFSMCGII